MGYDVSVEEDLTQVIQSLAELGIEAQDAGPVLVANMAREDMSVPALGEELGKFDVSVQEEAAIGQSEDKEASGDIAVAAVMSAKEIEEIWEKYAAMKDSNDVAAASPLAPQGRGIC